MARDMATAGLFIAAMLAAAGAAADYDADSWPATVDRLAAALCDPRGRGSRGGPLFLTDAIVTRIGSASTGLTPASLAGRFDGRRAVSVRTFSWPTSTVAADAGADLAEFAGTPAGLPVALVRALVPARDAGPAAEMAANRWLDSALPLADGDRIALLILWDARRPDRPAGSVLSAGDETELYERVTLIVARGGRDRLGRWRVAALRFGTAADVLAE